jgi:hypothetical protein
MPCANGKGAVRPGAGDRLELACPFLSSEAIILAGDVCEEEKLACVTGDPAQLSVTSLNSGISVHCFPPLGTQALAGALVRLGSNS